MKIKKLFESKLLEDDALDLNDGEQTVSSGPANINDGEATYKNKKIILELINNRIKELQNIGNALIQAIFGLEDNEDVDSLAELEASTNTRATAVRPLAKAIDGCITELSSLIDDNNLGDPKVTDKILESNNELVKVIYKLKESIEKPLINNPENLVADDFKQESNNIINILQEDVKSSKYIKELLKDTSEDNKESEEDNLDGDYSWKQYWKPYFQRAKNNGNEEEAWDYYYKKVWKNNSALIKGLGKAFKIEINYFGTTPYETENENEIEEPGTKGNPFVTFLKKIVKPPLPRDEMEGLNRVTANLKDVRKNAYDHIHNNYNKKYISDKDLAGTGNLEFGNVIFKADFYNLAGTELDNMIKLQAELIKTTKLQKKDKLNILYKDGHLRKLKEIKELMEISDINSKSDIVDEEVDDVARRVASKLERSNASIKNKLRNLLAILGVDRSTIDSLQNTVFNKYSGLDNIGELEVKYSPDTEKDIQKIFQNYELSTSGLIKLLNALIPKLNKNTSKKEETTTTA